MSDRLFDVEDFNRQVWLIVSRIPEGRVSTYGQIASMIPPPEGVDPLPFDRLAPQRVGRALRALPSGSSVPWHRVINSQGMISLPPGSHAADEQRARLEMEGITFGERGRVDFSVVGWEGPEDDWLRQHGFLAPRPLRNPSAGDDAARLSLF